MKTRIRQLTEQEKRSRGEQQMIADWLKIFPKGILSIVSDTFDLWKLITEYLPANKKAIMDRGHIEVIKLPLFNGKPTYCGKDWAIGDTLIKIGTAHQLGYWSENDDPDDNVYQNQRTKETINLTLLNDKGSEYFKYIPGKLVIRPDSGDPVDIICGLNIPEFKDESEIRDCFYNIDENKEFIFKYKEQFYIVNSNYTIEEHIREYGQEHWNKWKTLFDAVERYGYVEIYKPKFSISEQKGVIELLWDIFGGTVNEQGYKVLDPHIGAIYGDSITPERQKQIYERLAAKGFAATNIVLGVGSFTYQYNTRDTLGLSFHNCEPPYTVMYIE